MPSERLIELRQAGNRALASRNYSGAKEAFTALVREEPTSFEGYLGLAKVLERMGEHRAVIDLLEPVVESIDAAGVLRALGDAYRVLAYRGVGGTVDSAIKYYEAYREQRKDPVALFYLGELYREHKKDCERALSYLKESWDLDSGSRDVWNAAMDCANRLGRTDEVVALQKRWQERNTNHLQQGGPSEWPSRE